MGNSVMGRAPLWSHVLLLLTGSSLTKDRENTFGHGWAHSQFIYLQLMWQTNKAHVPLSLIMFQN